MDWFVNHSISENVQNYLQAKIDFLKQTWRGYVKELLEEERNLQKAKGSAAKKILQDKIKQKNHQICMIQMELKMEEKPLERFLDILGNLKVGETDENSPGCYPFEKENYRTSKRARTEK